MGGYLKRGGHHGLLPGEAGHPMVFDFIHGVLSCSMDPLGAKFNIGRERRECDYSEFGSREKGSFRNGSKKES